MLVQLVLLRRFAHLRQDFPTGNRRRIHHDARLINSERIVFSMGSVCSVTLGVLLKLNNFDNFYYFIFHLNPLAPKRLI